MKETEIQIVIDSREQRPLVLPNSIVKGLAVGDYSVVGYENRIAVERKSHADFVMCVAAERDRFERCLERLAKIEYPAIVLECSMNDLLEGTKYSKVHPVSAIGSLLAWGTRWRIPVWLAGDRRSAAATVRKILFNAVKYIETGE